MASITAESRLTEGYQARREHRLSDARAAYAEAAELSRQDSNPATLARSLAGMGRIERDLHQTEAALDLYQQAVTILRTLDGPLSLAHTVRHVGDIARELHQNPLAESSYEEALAIYRSSPETNTLDLANALRGYALLKAATGEKEAAISAWQQAGALYDQVWREPGSPYSEADLAPGVTESRRQIEQLSAV